MLIQRIPGVFNYCDSWCDRCRLQQACDVYHELRRMEDGAPPIEPPDPEVPARDWHDALDVPALTPEDVAEYAAEQQRRDALTAQHPVVQNASLYSRRAWDWSLLQDPEKPTTDPVVTLAWDSIRTLSLTVKVKAHRAIHELVDREMGIEPDCHGVRPTGVRRIGRSQELLPHEPRLVLLQSHRTRYTHDPT